jgi:hypothetical protein
MTNTSLSGDNEAINPIPALYLAGSIAVLQVAQMLFAGLETLEEVSLFSFFSWAGWGGCADG